MTFFKLQHVLSQESEWSCICVFGVSNFPVSVIFRFDLETVLTVLDFHFTVHSRLRSKIIVIWLNLISRQNVPYV